MGSRSLRGWIAAALPVGLTTAALLAASARPAGAQGMGMGELMHMMDWGRGSLVLIDQLEYAPKADDRALSLDAIGWVGGAYNRVWFRAEGEQPLAGNGGEGEASVYYGRLITPYWDALAGVRVDGQWGGDGRARASLAVGLVGLAPMRFEFSPTLFLSQDGDLSARLEAEYQILVTQRLVAEPEIEVNAALQEVPEFGVGSGINDVELGLRLRYEIRREFAPYVGYTRTRLLGGSADFARAEGESVRDDAFVAGLRVWF
ncbi:copper resistance protein B [Longimicrobium sp.]|uniref:copper resistance protein B n=1 Tax=Longimicrobium sp. TaxID=2029185 RepID=UPI002E2F44F1|nr:copper resistance protein B [Longimicrobium sp.]HEX6041907.1 copper resistance protein B [Longimicrobium sp.]